MNLHRPAGSHADSVIITALEPLDRLPIWSKPHVTIRDMQLQLFAGVIGVMPAELGVSTSGS